MLDQQRKMNERSLENLKLGAAARNKGKVRHNFTILPETMQWLKTRGNASDAIDGLVKAARNGELSSEHTHNRKEDIEAVSIDAYEREIQELKRDLEETQLELSKTRSLLEASREREKIASDLHSECLTDGFKAADILKAALELKANNGSKIKVEIKKALELIDDV